MKFSSARTRRAPSPTNTGNPLPDSLAPRGRSRMPRRSPSSQWGRGSNSNRGAAPQVRMTALALASPSGHSGGREVGHLERLALERRLDLAELGVERPDLVARRLEVRHQVVGGLLGPLAPGDLFGGLVAFGLERLHPRQDAPALDVEREDRVEHGVHGGIAPAGQPRPRPVGVLSQRTKVDHGISPSEGPGIRLLYPQFSLDSAWKVIVSLPGRVVDREHLELAVERYAEAAADDARTEQQDGAGVHHDGVVGDPAVGGRGGAAARTSCWCTAGRGPSPPCR